MAGNVRKAFSRQLARARLLADVQTAVAPSVCFDEADRPALTSWDTPLGIRRENVILCRYRRMAAHEIGAGEGNRTLVFSLEVSKSCSDFKVRSDIFDVFGPLRSLQNFSLSEWRL
jgi:hypothetical protein